MEQEGNIDINPTRYETISYGQGIQFKCLPKSFREGILEALIENHTQEAVYSVVGPLRDWKKSSYANYAKTHERMFKDTFDLDAPERNNVLLSRNPTEDELNVVRDIREISKDCIEKIHGDSITVYRGINYRAADIVGDLLNDSSLDEIPVQTTVLSNFTTIPEVAEDYGTVVITLDVNSACIAVASDHAFSYEVDGETYNPEGELRLFGEKLPNIKSSNVLFPTTRKPLIEGIRYPFDMTVEEHGTMEDILIHISNSGISLDGIHAKERMWNWFEAYREKLGFESKNRVLTIQELISTSLSN